MTRAKRYQGADKTEVTRASFANKIAEMTRVLNIWTVQGKRDDSFWPETLAALADWENPDKNIYKWKSPNVTQKGNNNYKEFVTAYWKLQKNALPYLRGDHLDTPQGGKKLNQALSQQNAVLVWQVMELRDALSRIDANNEALKRVKFP